MTDFDAERARRRLADPDEEERRRAIAEIPQGWTAGALPVLVEALGDASWRVRKEAIARVGRWPDADGAVLLLISTLADDSNVGLRNAAVEALSLIGAPAVRPLVTALQAGGEYRKFLIDALGAIGERGAAAALVACLDDPDENVRAAAAEALGRTGGADAVVALRRRLASGDQLARLAALEALNQLEAEVDVATLAAMLADPILRRAALEALGNTGDLEALPYLLDALGLKNRASRESAQRGIVALHEVQATLDARTRIESSVRAIPPAAVDGLITAVRAGEGPARRAAATLIGWGRWAQGVPALVAVLGEEDIHAAAARALVAYGPAAVASLVELAREAGPDLAAEIFGLFPRLGPAASDARVGEVLVRALADDDPGAAAAAARALGDVGGKDALGDLFHALEHRREGEVAHAAAQALARLGARYYDEVRMLIGARGLTGVVGVQLCRVLGAAGRAADRPLLLGALRDEDAALRRAAAEALAALGPAGEAVEALGYALADEDARVRAAAAEALGALGDRAAVPALLAAADDEEEQVRALVARALGQLGDPRAAHTLHELARGEGAVAMHALESLGRLRPLDAPGEEVLLAALGRSDPELVKAAVRALAARGGDAAARGLAQALDHTRWDVRRLVAQTLAARGAPPAAARDALVSRLRVESDPLVREALEAALAQA